MGEAKKRAASRAPNMQEIVGIDPRTGETTRVPAEVRHGGGLSTVKKHLGDVRCGSCRACCWHPCVNIQPDEDVTGLKTETRPDGTVALERKEDGSCVHLGPQGCTVYAKRPRACRGYDCRIFSIVGVRPAYLPGMPVWNFDIGGAEDRAFIMALRMSIAKELGPGEDLNEDDLMTATTKWKEHFQLALKMVNAFDALPRSQQEEIAKKLMGGINIDG